MSSISKAQKRCLLSAAKYGTVMRSGGFGSDAKRADKEDEMGQRFFRTVTIDHLVKRGDLITAVGFNEYALSAQGKARCDKWNGKSKCKT